MAAFLYGLSKLSFERNLTRPKYFLQQQLIGVNNVRNNHMFRHLAEKKEHDTEYTYEVSKDPNEWEFVERLMPYETVPLPIPKPSYPSGWRPSKDEALQLPYFVERSRNHMLSVYLDIHDRNKKKVTKLKKIHGDLWKLHTELKTHIEEVEGKKVASNVFEGNNVICFKGDHVYVIEQWLLSKGF